MTSRKLDFVVAGAQKSGTNTLDAILRRHPQIQMATVKETHFFDDESRDWRRPDYADLDSFFPLPDDRLRGECTPVTFYWKPALRRLHAYNPDAKLILLLRDPVTRAFSNWRHEYASGRETRPFSEAIRDSQERTRLHAETEGLHRYVSYVDRGLYGRQLTYALDRFGASNIHCEISEQFYRERAKGLQRLSVFLGIDPFPDDIEDLHLHQARNIPYPSTLTADDAAFLADAFREDVALLEQLLGRAIPEWSWMKARPRVSAAT